MGCAGSVHTEPGGGKVRQQGGTAEESGSRVSFPGMPRTACCACSDATVTASPQRAPLGDGVCWRQGRGTTRALVRGCGLSPAVRAVTDHLVALVLSLSGPVGRAMGAQRPRMRQPSCAIMAMGRTGWGCCMASRDFAKPKKAAVMMR